MKQKFIWEEYIDPLLSKQTKKEGDEEEPSYQDALPNLPQFQEMSIIPTPMGILPINDATTVSKTLSLWMLYTNFNITHEIAQLISKIYGVESLEIISRYRLRVGFPKTKLFNIESVKKDIEDALIGHFAQKFIQQEQVIYQLFNQSMSFNLTQMRQDIQSKYDYWVIYILPNGQCNIVTSHINNQHFQEKLLLYQQIYQHFGGGILSSEDN